MAVSAIGHVSYTPSIHANSAQHLFGFHFNPEDKKTLESNHFNHWQPKSNVNLQIQILKPLNLSIETEPYTVFSTM